MIELKPALTSAVLGVASSGFSKLNQGQRECLRLVLAHLNSKEISRELDVSPHTVDQRLRQAMKILGASSRFEAARKFAENEGADSYQPLIYQSPDIAISSGSANLSRSAKQGGANDQGSLNGMPRMESGSATISLGNPRSGHRRLPIPRFRGEKNELGAVERLGWIIAIAIGSAVSFGGILAGLEALSRLNG